MAALTEGDLMRRTCSGRCAGTVAAALTVLLLAAGCGDVKVTSEDGSGSASSSEDSSSTPDAVDTSAGEGDWLLAMTTAAGSDAETSITTYVTFNPATGNASARRMPPVKAGSATPETASLLVSGDRAWAIPDTGISRAAEKSGKLAVYSLADGTAKVVDIRKRTGQDDVNPVGWAFDPTSEATLRVVDSKNRVWKLDVTGAKATKESTLASGPWVFTNGFDPNTGKPWVESIDSDATKPAGQGVNNKDPVTRDGGTVLPSGSDGLAQLPASPCRLGAGFTDANGVTWAFCADKPTVSTYYLPDGGSKWTPYGKPSPAVAPTAAGFPLVLPPAA